MNRTITMLAAALAISVPNDALAQTGQTTSCPNGREPVGDLGIEELRCSSGRCLRGFTFEDDRLITTFTTEPRVHALKPPADAVLQEGDVIVAVDGLLSTTAEAGKRLAKVEPGDRVRLKIRRDGTEREVTITASSSCDRVHRRVFAFDGFDFENFGEQLGELRALEHLNERLEDLDIRIFTPEFEFEPDDFRFEFDSLDVRPVGRVRPPYELGLELTCGFFCGWRRGEGDAVVWRGQHPPKVARVIEGGPADRAGIREGDVLLLLDGNSFVGEAGGRALGRLQPGRALALQYLKDGETLTTTTITPRPPSED
ncbi:MAG TPA: PDZ domain-containing protein [Gemmatimonadota bacterium]|nr:PDZ domain-containing protein [Gemmatimonadota bacterium]